MSSLITPQRAYRFFRKHLNIDVEEFWIAALDCEKRVIASQCLFRGTVDHCLFHARDVFRFAMAKNASCFMVAHNHPAGDPRPSAQDLAVTERLLFAAQIIEIPLLDHIILGRRRYYSFVEDGRIPAVSAV